MKKYILYPYNKNAYALVKFWEQNNSSKIVGIFAPKSYGIEGRDGGEIYGFNSLGHEVKSDYFDQLLKSDGVIIPPILIERSIEKVFEIIVSALQAGKDVICYCKLKKDYMKKVNSLLNNTAGKFFYRVKDEEILIDKEKENLKWYIPEIPVVLIGETLNGLNAAEIACELFYEMSFKGYNPVAIVEYAYTFEENMVKLPDFLNSEELVYDEKVLVFNSFIKRIINKYRPDILFIQIPKSMIKQNIYDRDNFGVLPYIISQAVNADYAIVCDVLRQLDTEEQYIQYYEEMCRCFWYRFGISIDEICLSNVKIDLAGSYARGHIVRYTVENNEVEHLVQLINKKIQPVLYSGLSYEVRKSSSRIIDKLS